MMENKLVYKVERLISYSAMDSSTKYSMYSAAAAAQDGLTENFGMLKIDNFTIFIDGAIKGEKCILGLYKTEG